MWDFIKCNEGIIAVHTPVKLSFFPVQSWLYHTHGHN